MNLTRPNLRLLARTFAVLGLAIGIVTSTQAQGRKKNPTSKLYVADVDGKAQIDTGETIDELSNKSVYTAQGTVIQTDKDSTNAMVFSNGTGIVFEPNTRLEVRKFVQEPFTPNRSDMDVEPSVSTTVSYLARGTVGLCTSKMVAGSTMTYSTPNASIRVKGRKVVIQATDKGTTVSLLEGEVTVHAGDQDVGGEVIRPGQQAFIPASGGPAQVINMDKAQLTAMDEKVSTACNARKKVYFEARDKENKTGGGGSAGDEVTAFNQEGAESDDQEIVPVETTPGDIPVQLTVSAANLPK